MATHRSDTTQRDVTLQLSHPTGPGGQRAELRVIDAESHLEILRVEIPPEDFYGFLIGRVDGGRFPADVLRPEIYARVGDTRYHWQRQVGFGVPWEAAEAWAAELATRLGLHAWTVRPRRGGLWATWELWSSTHTPAQLDDISTALTSEPLPPRST